MKQLKPKPCRYCKNEFTPRTSLQVTCSPPCAIGYVYRARERSENAAIRKAQSEDRACTAARKTKAKTRTAWLKDLQTLVNRYVRLRDEQDGCISCDKPPAWNGQWHCSHYYSVGSSSSVRFNLWNLHKSCSVCNNHKSGNIGEYTPRIIEKIGQKKFDWLYENRSAIAKYDIDWIKRAIKIARKGIKRLEQRS